MNPPPRHTGHPARAVAAALLALAAPGAQALGFVPAGGDWAAQPLAVPAPPSPAPSTLPLGPHRTLWRDQGGQLYLAMGAGLPAYQIPAHPLGAAWALKPAAGERCPLLEPVPLERLQAPDVAPVPHNRQALPLACTSGFESLCRSPDGQLEIRIHFDGRQRDSRRRGGFFGSEAPIPVTVHSGRRTLAIEHRPSGLQARFEERLHDTPAYTAPEGAITYLPELQTVLLLGLGGDSAPGAPSCLRLP